MDKTKIEQLLKRIESLLANNKRVLSISEASLYTGYKVKYLHKLTCANKIPFSKPNNGAVFFDKDQLDQWLLSKPRTTSNESKQKALNYTLKNKR